MMFLDEERGEIIRDMKYLEESYVPEEIRFRGGQLKEIARCISPLLHGRDMINIFIYGSTGTGKTSSVKWAFRQIGEETSKVLTAYVNCWENPTNYAIATEIMKQTIQHGELRALSFKRNFAEIINEVKEALSKSRKRLIVALDEIDKAEDTDIIYALSRNNIGIIMISNDPYALKDIDKRIESSLHFTSIEYKPYTLDEMMNILKERAINAFYPGAFPQAFIRVAAVNAQGDARVGIAIMRNAALIAESKNKKKVEREDLVEAVKMSRRVKVSQVLSTLKREILLLYEIIEKKEEVDAGELWEEYKRVMKSEGKEISERTFRNYIQKLISLKLIKSKGETRWRKYYIYRGDEDE